MSNSYVLIKLTPIVAFSANVLRMYCKPPYLTVESGS